MKFHKWIDLDDTNRVCDICNRHERSVRLRGHPFQLVVRDGKDEGQCSLIGRLRRFFVGMTIR